MSFAYIDSQGNEVPIPGPDALRLRIELGAIADATQFYDSAADRWAPASEHEIYRQLKRELESGGGAGFVAPPPSSIDAPPSPIVEQPEAPAEVQEEPEASVEEFDASEPIAFEDPVTEDAPADFDAAAFDAPAAEDDGDELGFGSMTFTDEGLAGEADALPAEPEPAQAEPSDAPPVDDSFDFGADDLTLADDAGDDEAAEDSGFDFGSGDLELAGDDAAAEAPGGQWDVSADLAGSAPLPGDVVEEEPDFGNAFDSGDDVFGGDADVGGGLEVEGSDMSGFDADDAASWMQSDPPEEEPVGAGVAASGEPAMDHAADEGEERADPYQRNIRERTGPKSAPPRRPVTPKSGGAGKLIGIAVAVLVLGGGGAFFVMNMGSSDAEDAAIELPELPTDLQPQLRQLAQRASQRMVEEFDSLPQRVALPAEPGAEWLSGRYMASASTYPQVQEYWTGFGELLDEMIAIDDRTWRAAFEDEVVTANMTTENTGLVRERGLLGWEASAGDREIVYDQLRRVIDSALDLHAFLIQNESNIEFTAVGPTGGDPFAEIETISDELGDELLARVSAIPENLDALGYLRQVETEPLFGVVKEKLVATGIR